METVNNKFETIDGVIKVFESTRTSKTGPFFTSPDGFGITDFSK